MKIVCDACSAKYSIADDKVKGKVFKIRCKKCSNIIVVRGTAGAGGADEPAPAQFDQKDTRVYDYGYDDAGAPAGAAPPTGADADAVWHVVVDQEQVGPLTVGEVQEKFASGQVDADTYVWREGFADWQPLATVDAFAHFASGGGGSSGADAVSSMFGAAGADDGGTVRSNPDDLFAARSGGTAQRDDEGDSGDLFGARAAAPAAAASAPRADAGGGKLRGERNENSVLFSLGNLAALASDAPRASAASSSSSSSSSSSGGGAAQHGGGEGSGLIDIRSMASAYLGDKPGAAKKQQSNVGSIDDLPVFSAAAFSEPAVIMPGPVHRQSNKTMMMLIGGVAALAVITLGLVLFIVLGDKKEGAAPPPAVAAGETKPGDDKGVDTAAKTGDTAGDPAGAGAGDTAGTGAGTAAGAATPPEDEDKPATGTTAAEDDKKPSDKKPDAKKPDSKRDDRRSSSSSDKKPEEKKPEPSSSGGGCMDEVGCLLADKPPSCCSKYSKGKKPTEKKPTTGNGGGGGGDLPESLDSDMVKDGVAKVKSRIFACGDKYPSAKGTLKLSVKVSSSGSVTSVDVVNTPDAGLGTCAKSAMKGAKFGKTQRGGSFKYPFNF